MKHYVIGLDFGTLSVRGVLMDVSDGCLKAEAAADYAHGVMDRTLPDGTPLLKDFPTDGTAPTTLDWRGHPTGRSETTHCRETAATCSSGRRRARAYSA